MSDSPHYIVFDTETTGVNPSLLGPVRPISIGMIAYSFDLLEGDGVHNYTPPQEIARFHTLINPKIWADTYQIAEQTHGIPRARVEAEGIRWQDAWAQIASFTEQYSDAPLFAWNAPFDLAMLTLLFNDAYPTKRQAVTLPGTTWSNGMLHAPRGCLMRLYDQWQKRERSIVTSKKLETAFERVVGHVKHPAVAALQAQSKHDAIVDVQCAAFIFHAIRQRTAGSAG